MNKVFIGYDSSYPEVYEVARHSILRRSTGVEVYPLKRDELNYTRGEDPLSSTEFTFTRFMVPQLTDGWALFCDNDFLFLDDVSNLFSMVDNKYAMMCVKHDYTPLTKTKMDGKHQYVYPRKNWSSLMLWNCDHPDNQNIDVNDESKDGKWFHRFSWLKDDQIGEIPYQWNWLVGYYSKGTPKALHYTDGGPWVDEYKDTEYSKLWIEENEDRRLHQTL